MNCYAINLRKLFLDAVFERGGDAVIALAAQVFAGRRQLSSTGSG